MKSFADLVIVELAGSVAGSYAGKMFADLGARVLKVEPPGGDPARAEGEPLPGMGTLFAALNTSKESVVLDAGTAEGLAGIDRLLAGADVVIESSSPEPLRPLTANAEHPHLVKLYLSPFGLTGPYADYRSNAFTDYALSGHMYLNGEPDREPIQGAGRQPEYAAAVHGFIGAMAALWAREDTGRGQTVDVSHIETMASLHQWTTVRWTHGHFIQRRVGNRYDSTHPITIYPCKDGHVAISAAADPQAERLLAVAGLAHLLDDPRFATGVARLQNADAFDAELRPWLMAHTAAEIIAITQAVRVPVAGAPGLLELLEDPHLAARDFWIALDGLRYPGPPFRMSRHRWALRSAPPVGEHRGMPPSKQRAGGKGTDESAGSPSSSMAEPSPGPLAGIRILDLSRVWAGPLATRILGDLGADVIRVEAVYSRGPKQVSDAVVLQSKRYPENQAGVKPWNREGMFNKFNRNKRAVTLQLDTARGKAVFEALVRQADVVLENYSPRVMPQLGLDYERLRELNPGIIYIGMPGFGWNGPNRDFVALGTMLEPAAGLSSLMGYPDSGPYKSGVAWADPVAAINGAAAVLVALWDRRLDPEGRGQAIELAQLEGMIGFIGEEILAAQVRGCNPARPGNRHPARAPQGVYPCAGDDRWIAVSVTSDGEWRALCELAGFGPERAALTFAERRARHDELDRAIAAWTAGHDPSDLMRRLQGRGVIACALHDARGMVEDPHLAARGFFVAIAHPDAGTYPFPGQPIHLSETPATFRLPAPGLGEHNREVFGGLLGMSDAEMDELRAAGIIAEEPVG